MALHSDDITDFMKELFANAVDSGPRRAHVTVDAFVSLMKVADIHITEARAFQVLEEQATPLQRPGWWEVIFDDKLYAALELEQGG